MSDKNDFRAFNAAYASSGFRNMILSRRCKLSVDYETYEAEREE